MKDTFERLYKKNLEAFVLSFKREPSKTEADAIRKVTHVQVAFIGAVLVEKDTYKFLDFWQNDGSNKKVAE